jgi:hypothetical protein
MDEFDSDTTSFSESTNEQHLEGSSRRKFLKAAVVGSAAAVAVSGVGAATLSLTGHHTGLRKFLVLGDTLSTVTSHACTTNSDDVSQSTFGNDTIFIWFKFDGVPASGSGYYTFDVSPEPGASGSPVAFPPGSGSSYVQVVAYPGGVSFTCNPSSLPSSGFVQQQSTLPVTFQTSSDGDVLLWLHVKSTGTTTGSVSLTAALYQGTTATGTPVDSAVATFTLS